MPKNMKNNPYAVPNQPVDVQQRNKALDLQEKIEAQRKKEKLKLIELQIDPRTKILCRPEQVRAMKTKYGLI